MTIWHVAPDRRPRSIDAPDNLPDEGFVWISLVREEAAAQPWTPTVERWTGVTIRPEHVIDSLNPEHPGFHDGTSDYDLIVFRELVGGEEGAFRTRQTTFFLFERLLVTIRSGGGRASAETLEEIEKKIGRAPRRPAGLMHRILSHATDGFLAIRPPLIEKLESWQTRLLDPADPFNDWQSLMDQRNRLRRLEALTEQHEDAIRTWQAETPFPIGEDLSVRFADLLEHNRRVLDVSRHLQAQIESLVQIHFAATAHRTNEIMKVLTVVASIFMPLTFVAGVYGMNFENMPELGWRYSYFVLLGFLIGAGATLFLWFRGRKWI